MSDDYLQSIPVLDKGYVRLVDYMGDDLAIVRAARVSHDAAWRAGEQQGSDARLIRFLMKNGHTSPFEHVTFTFEVKAPLFIFRQWHRHRTWSYNEVSGRYTTLKDEFYVPSPDVIGAQDSQNKQKRNVDEDAPDEAKALIDDYVKRCEDDFAFYQRTLKAGWPKELARAKLPLSTYSAMFATVDLHNLFHFIRLRDDSHAQYEAQQYGRALRRLIEPIVPVALAAFDEQRG